MKYSDCLLYGIRSKRMLKYILQIKNDDMLKQSNITSKIHPYIDKTKKPRLIEAPQAELKIVQRRIKTLLGKIQTPDNVFSGIKGKSYPENARMHIGGRKRNLYKTDLTAFFPSISREDVYQFFNNELCCSPDVSEVLTNLTTVSLERFPKEELTEVYDFLGQKGVHCYNHLISGAPTSQILSYLVNHKMFDELHTLSAKNDMVMTVYVDDMVFSSEHKISSHFRNAVKSIIKKYRYKLSHNKVKGYSKGYPKLVTGVVIDCNENMIVKNSLQHKIILEFEHLRKNPMDQESRQRLRGLVTSAQQIDKSIFPNIKRFAFENPSK